MISSASEWNREYNEQAAAMREWAKGRRTETIRAKWNGARRNSVAAQDDPRLVATVVVLAEVLAERGPRPLVDVLAE